MSLETYGSVLDLGILRESYTGTYMGTGYAILSVPKNDDRSSSLSHHLPWYQSEDEGSYAVWSDMPTYCRYCHAEGHAVPDCPKKLSSRVCWNCRTSGHIAAECTKKQIKMMYAQSSGLFSDFLLLTILISGLSAAVCFPLSEVPIGDLLLTASLLLINSWSFVLCRSLSPSKEADSTLTSMFHRLNSVSLGSHGS
ncbi:hypothetical protein G6F37_008106 [Rhizopus arrhizus]|nr:hypothetical protein G6F38_008186 [Rhizopus arrhizus]KAG1155901.1 hypothetical protein G6F37_008106 [Rhizopus arrhizus]